MKKQLSSLILLILISTYSRAQITFQKIIGGSVNDVASSIVQTNDGGYVICGSTRSFGAGNADAYVIKLDSNGNLQWTKTIGGSDDDVAFSIVQTNDGGYAIGGATRSFGAGDYDFYVIKLNSNGNLQWTKTIGGSSGDYANSIIQTLDHGYALTGTVGFIGAGNQDVYVVKLDSIGNLQWTKTIGGSDDEIGATIIQNNDGNYIIAGQTNSFGQGDDDFYLIKLNSNGILQWTKTIGGVNTETFSSMTKSNDGGYVLGGVGESYTLYPNFYIVKFDSSGNPVWTKTIGISGNFNLLYSIVKTNDGGFVAGGSTMPIANNNIDVYVVKIDSIGNLQWTKTIGGNNSDESISIIQTYNGGYAMCGNTNYFSPVGDIYFLALDSIGNICGNTGSGGTVGSGGSISSGGTASSGGSVDSGGTVSSGGTVTDICTGTGIEEIENRNNELEIYPNPANDIIYINSKNNFSATEIILYDASGREVMKKKFNKDASFSVKQLNAGIYFYKIKGAKGNEVRGKLVKPACR